MLFIHFGNGEFSDCIISTNFCGKRKSAPDHCNVVNNHHLSYLAPQQTEAGGVAVVMEVLIVVPVVVAADVVVALLLLHPWFLALAVACAS